MERASFNWLTGFGRLSSLALCLLSISLAPLAVRAADPDSPRDLGRWIEELKSGDPQVRREAAYQLNQLGPDARDAVPALIEALDDREQQVWFLSVMTLAQIGPEAAAAVPALIEDLEGNRQRYDEQVWYRSAYALSRIGRPAFDALTNSLTHRAARVRSGAAKALGWMDDDAEAAIPLLVARLSDSDDEVRRYASEALGEIGPAALKPMTAALEAESAVARAAAASALAWMGPSARASAPALTRALASESDSRAEAEEIRALSQLKAEPDVLGPLLASRLTDPDEAVKQAAINAFLMMESPETSVVPRLIQLLSEGAELRLQAAYVLGRIGEASTSAVPELIRNAQTASSPDDRARFVEALSEIGRPAVPALLQAFKGEEPASLDGNHWIVQTLGATEPSVVNELITALAAPELSVRLGAALSLAQQGEAARDAQGPLLAWLSTAPPPARAPLIRTLTALELKSDFFTTELEMALSDSSPAVRHAAVDGLAELGPQSPPLALSLTRLLDDPAPEVQIGAVRALGAMGDAAADSVGALTERLGRAPEPLQRAIVRALGAIGPEAVAGLPQLVELLRHDSSELRSLAVESLGQMGPVAAGAVPALQQIVGDPSEEVRESAVRAFARIENRTEAVLSFFLQTLDDQSSQVRVATAKQLERMGTAARPAAPGLFAMLDRELEREAALDALRQIRPVSIELLIAALDNGSPGVRVFACDALGRMGARAIEALPALQRLLDDEYRFVRRRAQEAIDRIRDEDT